ncbi:hypothetical protein E2C01_070825 [Portunus trituberculatus]|uniref:Reverse transcriptase zinc-binding domain-containing protein n=1 Tax=Portunus trituberculatus TaxID=210409 RepID=A0A5B7I2P3_PORTR|nr:hypothetical protein [Portunus trituberculatus]
MSAVTRFKQSVSHGKEQKAHQLLPTSAWATLVTTLSALLHRLRRSRDHFCPWCRTIPEAMEHFLLHCPRLLSQHTALRSRLCPGHHNTQPALPPGSLRRPPLLATCCPSPYLCLFEEDRPATNACDTHTGLPQGSQGSIDLRGLF